MSDPKKLKVGDKIRFVSLPDEWQVPEFSVDQEDIEFMKMLIAHNWPSRIYGIDERGMPWIAARIRTGGRIHYHTWGISERTGWRLVRRRV